MDRKGGWIKLYRSVWDTQVFEKDGPYNWRGAWIDMLLMANHENGNVSTSTGNIEIRRGEFLTSIYNLSKRWQWDRKRVYRFLKKLENADMIRYTSATTSGTIVTIVNYDVFQNSGSSSAPSPAPSPAPSIGASVGANSATQTRSKEYKNDKEVKKYKSRPWGGIEEPE